MCVCMYVCVCMYECMYVCVCMHLCMYVQGGAVKFLTPPGKKQATATKLGIYLTYSPRSSIHFLNRSSTFESHSKKIRILSVQPDLCGSNDLRVGWKMTTFQLFFQAREQVVVRQGQIRRIRWVIKTLEAQVGQFFWVAFVRWAGAIVVQEQDPLGDLPGPFFLQNVLLLHHQKWVMIRVDSLALWKITNEEDAVLVPKKSRWVVFQRICASQIFWNVVSRYAATPLIVALSTGLSAITRFLPWSPIATGNHLHRVEKNSKFAQTIGDVDVFYPRSGISVPTSRRVSACPNLHERWTQPTHMRCPVAKLLI